MAFIYLMIGTGIAALLVAAWVAVYEHNRMKRLNME